MRVLLVVPDIANINADREINYITSFKHVTAHVLSGHVDAHDLHDAVGRNGYFDVVHFGTHTSNSPPRLQLSDGELTPEDVNAVLRRSRCGLVFFNSCNSGVLASRAVNAGIRWAIYTNVELVDEDAWKMPLAFYESLNKQARNNMLPNYPAAFSDAISDTGHYGITGSYERTRIIDIRDTVATLKFWIVASVVLTLLNFLGLGVHAWFTWGSLAR